MIIEYTFDEDTVSDLHKDAFGFRPCGNFWPIWENSSNAQKQIIWDDLLESLDASVIAEKEAAALAENVFEKRITDIQELMNNSRIDAIRVIIEAEDKTEDVKIYGYELIEYEFGLSYGYIERNLK